MDRVLISIFNCHVELIVVFSLLPQDPVKDGEAKIRADFDQLHEDLQTTFRNLED